jgi:hypothetical protein
MKGFMRDVGRTRIASPPCNPPPESTLSLSSGTLSLELRVYSPQTAMGARVIAELATGGSLSSCVTLETSSDLRAGRTETVVVSGPTLPSGGRCDIRVPTEEIRVRVVKSDGFEVFRTGIPPLHHLRVLYHLTE